MKGEQVDMMVLNNIGVVQVGCQYHFYTQNNIYLGAVAMPDNGQLAFDTKMLDVITKALAIRWGIIPMPKKG